MRKIYKKSLGFLLIIFIISLVFIGCGKKEIIVTKAEFDQVKEGMTLKEVQDIVGNEGTLSSNSTTGDNEYMYYYWSNGDVDGSLSEMDAIFINGLLNTKTAHNLK